MARDSKGGRRLSGGQSAAPDTDFDFSLDEEEMHAIAAMDNKQRTAGIPEDMLPYYKD